MSHATQESKYWTVAVVRETLQGLVNIIKALFAGLCDLLLPLVQPLIDGAVKVLLEILRTVQTAIPWVPKILSELQCLLSASQKKELLKHISPR